MEKIKKEKKNSSEIKWLITVFITTFILSMTFSYISTESISSINIFLAVMILMVVMLIGIVADMIGVAITIAEESEFHAKASKKAEGAKTAIRLIRNAPKVANICGDVIGDIAGVLSGAMSAVISIRITSNYNLSFDTQFIISGLVASLTVAGKAIGKMMAQKYNTQLVDVVSKVLHIFRKRK